MTSCLWLLIAPVAYLHLGAAGVWLVTACAAAIFGVALASEGISRMLSAEPSAAVLRMACGAACRMAFVVALLVVGVKLLPDQLPGVPRSSIPIYLIPFYFGLLVVEVFTAKAILSNLPSASTDTVDGQHAKPLV